MTRSDRNDGAIVRRDRIKMSETFLLGRGANDFKGRQRRAGRGGIADQLFRQQLRFIPAMTRGERNRSIPAAVFSVFAGYE